MLRNPRARTRCVVASKALFRAPEERCVGKSEVLRARFGSRAKALLRERGLTIGELAERTALSVARLGSILDGTLVSITLNEMTALADVLDRPLFRLLVPVDPALCVEALEKVEERRARHA